jgi:hypothetical protein
MDEPRRVEVKKEGTFVQVPSLVDVKKGDWFRMFEPDGTPFEKGSIFEAFEDGYFDEKAKQPAITSFRVTFP